mgnify:CR=1 FL=1
MHERSSDPRASHASGAYRDYQRQRQMTLGDLLLENRIILLQGEIYDGNANEVVMKKVATEIERRTIVATNNLNAKKRFSIFLCGLGLLKAII